MGVDTKLFVNTRWSLEDLQHIIESKYGKITIKSNHDFAVGYFNFSFGKRMMHVFCNHQTPIGSCTYLSLAADDESYEIMKYIASRIGGIFMENDCDGNCEMIDGNMWEEDALPYFLKYAIVEKGIDPNSVKSFLAVKREWEKRIAKSQHIF